MGLHPIQAKNPDRSRSSLYRKSPGSKPCFRLPERVQTRAGHAAGNGVWGLKSGPGRAADGWLGGPDHKSGNVLISRRPGSLEINVAPGRFATLFMKTCTKVSHSSFRQKPESRKAP